ncbi:MAG: VacJ family lipoprotein [Motiliproteus sp.]
MRWFLKWKFWPLLMAIAVSGCSTTSAIKETPQTPAMQAKVSSNQAYPIDVHDPWERFNRGMYNFNAKFDRYLFIPVVDTYETILPNFVEAGVSNFFSNLGEISNIINSALQLKGTSTVVGVSRLALNTTVGILGLWDPATLIGIYEKKEDFGQALGYWGVGSGPYLVMPILGPSSLRDTAGFATDSLVFNAIDPLNYDDHSNREAPVTGLKTIDARHNVKFRYLQGGTPFEYEKVRYLYLKKREFDILK